MPTSASNLSNSFLTLLRQDIFEPLSASETDDNRPKYGLDLADIARLQQTCKDAFDSIPRPVSADINHLMHRAISQIPVPALPAQVAVARHYLEDNLDSSGMQPRDIYFAIAVMSMVGHRPIPGVPASPEHRQVAINFCTVLHAKNDALASPASANFALQMERQSIDAAYTGWLKDSGRMVARGALEVAVVLGALYLSLFRNDFKVTASAVNLSMIVGIASWAMVQAIGSASLAAKIVQDSQSRPQVMLYHDALTLRQHLGASMPPAHVEYSNRRYAGVLEPVEPLIEGLNILKAASRATIRIPGRLAELSGVSSGPRLT